MSWPLIQNSLAWTHMEGIEALFKTLKSGGKLCHAFSNEKFTFSVLGFLSLGQPPYSCDSFFQDFSNPDIIVAELWRRTRNSDLPCCSFLHLLEKSRAQLSHQVWSETKILQNSLDFTFTFHEGGKKICSNDEVKRFRTTPKDTLHIISIHKHEEKNMVSGLLSYHIWMICIIL